MKKKLLIILVLLLLVTGCKKKPDIDPEIAKARDNIVKTIGATNDNKVVIKFKDKDKHDCYYVYVFNYAGYNKYKYTFYSTKTTYRGAKDNIDPIKYSLESYDNAWVLKILEKKYNVISDTLKQEIIDTYKDKKGYEVVY